MEVRLRILNVVPPHWVLLVVNLPIEHMTLFLKSFRSHFHRHVYHYGLPSKPAFLLILSSLLVERDEAHVVHRLQLVVRVEVADAALVEDQTRVLEGKDSAALGELRRLVAALEGLVILELYVFGIANCFFATARLFWAWRLLTVRHCRP